jgi:hypothetical protein
VTNAGVSQSDALTLIGEKSLPSIQAGIISHMSEEDQRVLVERLAKTSQTISAHIPDIEVSSELKERILTLGQSVAQGPWTAREAVVLPPAPRPPDGKKRKARRQVPTQEQVARRVFKRQRKAAISFLKEAGLKAELDELRAVEAGVAKGSKRSCMHAAYSARVLMEGLADHLFPPTTKARKGRDGRKHSLDSKDFKNRLIAYAEKQLEGQWEGHEFRAFVAILDVVMRWTGSGPHGGYDQHEAEHMYPRLLDALAVLARAHAVKAGKASLTA